MNFKNILSRKNKIESLESSMAYPVHFVRDWRMVVLVFALGLISLSLFAWRIYLSDKIAGGYLDPEIIPTEVSIKIIDQQKLEDDLLLLDTKQTDYLKLKASPLKLVDPSL